VSELRRAHVLVRGRVQAVGFRASAFSRARSLGIAGWVQNTLDGAVEAELEGPPERLELLLDWFGRGPHGARVDDVSIEWREPVGGEGFFVR
jgi:acylphosphatase